MSNTGQSGSADYRRLLDEELQLLKSRRGQIVRTLTAIEDRLILDDLRIAELETEIARVEAADAAAETAAAEPVATDEAAIEPVVETEAEADEPALEIEAVEPTPEPEELVEAAPEVMMAPAPESEAEPTLEATADADAETESDFEPEPEIEPDTEPESWAAVEPEPESDEPEHEPYPAVETWAAVTPETVAAATQEPTSTEQSATAPEPSAPQEPAATQRSATPQEPATVPQPAAAPVAAGPAAAPVALDTAPSADRPAAPAPRKSRRAGLRRVPGLDGLRGLAVLAVIIYHFFGDALPGGYLGVDVFFVLSGFLITSLLVREHGANGRIDLKDFWVRRARRILPAALFVLVMGTAVAGAVGGDAAVGLGAQFLGTLFFVNNWTQIAGSQSYFAESGVQLFAHFWSLAVEEQFYVLFPLVFVGLLALGVGKRRMKWVTAIGALASFALMVAIHDPESDPTRVYYGTDTHAFGLLIGVTLALWMTTDHAGNPDSWPRRLGPLRNPAAAAIAGTVALGGLVALFFLLPDTAPITYRGGLLTASVLTAIVLTAVVREQGPASALFRTAPMRWLGERSFSLYLWHWPVMVLVSELLNRADIAWWGITAGMVSLAISLPLSHWSYRWIETPIRRRGYARTITELRERPRAQQVAMPVAAVVVLFATGLSIGTSPAQNSLERDLEAMAARTGEAGRAEMIVEEEPQRTMPEGDRITAIGDSVMLASSEALMTEFPGIYVDGAVSRHYQEAPGIIAEMEAAGTLDQFVVLGFGTNGPSSGAYEGLLDEIIDQLGPDRTVLLVLPYGDRWYMPEAEAEVLAAAERYDNVYVADWCRAARDDSTKLRADLVHPTVDGASAYSGAIRDALNQWVERNKAVPGVCGV